MLAWVLVNRDVSTLILGISKVEQFDENVKALEVAAKWDKALEERVEALLKNGPEPRIDFRKFAPVEQRRIISVLGDKR